MMLHVYHIDILAVTEANFDKNQNEEECKIKGYDMFWDRGREHVRRQNARVVTYVREEIDAKVETKLMEDDLIPEVWLSIGESSKRRFLIGAIYREHKPWKHVRVGDKEGKTPAEQTERWRRWLEAKAGILQGDKEVVLLGDFNLQIDYKADYTYRKMSRMLHEEVLDRGWKAMTTGPTRWEYTIRGEQESSVDLLLTNKPEHTLNSGIVEQPGHSDHHLVWMSRIMEANKKAKRITQKRCWKKFTREDLKKAADLVTWRFQGRLTGCMQEVDMRTRHLEDNIKLCMEMVARMRMVKDSGGKPAWITQELLEARKERERKRQIAKRTQHPDDFKVWRLLRNKVNRDLNKARKKHLERGLQDKITNSASLHKGVTEFLGWRDAGDPQTLVSYKMVQKQEEKEKRQEGQDPTDRVPNSEKDTASSCKESLGWEEQNENHVLEGALPKLREGWTWVKEMKTATEPTEIAEAMVKQYLGKNLSVRKAIGHSNGEYLERVRRMTVGNCSKFRIQKVTEEQVKNMIRKVDSKGSFGVDLISYKDIKLLEKYVARPLTELVNLSIETRYYPSRWKTARVKPLWKGEGNDRKIPKSYRPVDFIHHAQESWKHL